MAKFPKKPIIMLAHSIQHFNFDIYSTHIFHLEATNVCAPLVQAQCHNNHSFFSRGLVTLYVYFYERKKKPGWMRASPK